MFRTTFTVTRLSSKAACLVQTLVSSSSEQSLLHTEASLWALRSCTRAGKGLHRHCPHPHTRVVHTGMKSIFIMNFVCDFLCSSRDDRRVQIKLAQLPLISTLISTMPSSSHNDGGSFRQKLRSRFTRIQSRSRSLSTHLRVSSASEPQLTLAIATR